MLARASLALLIAAGCGSSNDTKNVDAAASASTVMEVDCAANPPNATIKTMSFMFMPADTPITVGQVVQWQLETAHTLTSDAGAGMTDSGIKLTAGQTGCLKFTAAGTFHYMCGIHNTMKGTVTVH